MYSEKPLAILWEGNWVIMYEITVGAIDAVPIPTINLAIIIDINDDAVAVNILPKTNIPIPIISIFFLPITSLNLPKIGVKTADDIDSASAVQVVLLYSKFISFTKAGPKTVVSPPIKPIKKAAKAYGINPVK